MESFNSIALSGIFLLLTYFILALYITLIKFGTSRLIFYFFVHTLLFCLTILLTELGFSPKLPDSDIYLGVLELEEPNIGILTYKYVYDWTQIFGDFFLNTVAMNSLFLTIIFLNFARIARISPIKKRRWRYSLFIGLILLYPSVFLYIITPTREALITLALSFILYYSSRIITSRQSWRSYVELFFWIGLSTLLRYQLSIVYIVTAMIFFGAHFGIWKKVNYKLSLNIILIQTIVIVPVLLFTINSFFARYLDPSQLAHDRNIRVQLYSPLSYGKVEWNTALDVVFDIPQLVVYFITSPLLTDPIWYTKIGNSIDSVYVILLMCVYILLRRRRKGIFTSTDSLIEYFMLSYLVIMAVGEFHTSDAVRHRIPLVIPMVFLCTRLVGGYRTSSFIDIRKVK